MVAQQGVMNSFIFGEFVSYLDGVLGDTANGQAVVWDIPMRTGGEELLADEFFVSWFGWFGTVKRISIAKATMLGEETAKVQDRHSFLWMNS
jgi:hypothetical protein